MVRDRAFIFHIHIPWGKTLSLVPKSMSSVKVKYQGHSFRKKMVVARALVLHKHGLFGSGPVQDFSFIEMSVGCILPRSSLAYQRKIVAFVQD